MTSADTAACVPRTCPAAVRVAIAGTPPLSADAFREAVTAVASELPVDWDVRSASEVPERRSVDIVLCGSAAAVRDARRYWPDAGIVVLVPAVGSGTAVLAALDAGARVCVRDTDPVVVAAYVGSVVRRRRLGTGR